MRDQKRNNDSPIVRDDPFMNDKLYPFYVIISCSFLDSYVQNNLHSYNVMLPGNPKYGTKNIYMNQVATEFNKILDALSAKISDVCSSINNNSMKKLKDMYKEYNSHVKDLELFSSKELDDAINKLKDLSNDENAYFTSTTEMFKDSEVMHSVLAKEFFLGSISDLIIETSVKPMLSEHNSITHNLLSFIINDRHLLCIDRTKGILKRVDNININPIHMSYLLASSRDLFNNYNNNKSNKEKANRIFLLDLELLINIKGRPFLYIEDINKNNFDKMSLLPSDEVVTIINNSDDDINDDDDYDDFDWDDEDDDI